METATADEEEQKYETGVYIVDGKQVYFENGKRAAKTGVATRVEDGAEVYVEKGVFKQVTGAVKRISDGKWVYVEKGLFEKATGVVKRISDGKWVYVENGIFKKATGLAKRKTDGKWLYVKDGVFKNSTGVVKRISDKKMYYVKKGIYTKDTLFSKLADSTNTKLYQVKNGVVQQNTDKLKITVSNFGSDSARLMVKWNLIPGAKGYIVYRSTSKNGTYKIVNITETASYKFLDNNLYGSTTYYYKVYAYVGSAIKGDKKYTTIAKSGIGSAKTKAYSSSVHYSPHVRATASNTITLDSINKTSAKKVYDKLLKGYNFYVYIKNSGTHYKINKLNDQIRNLSDLGLGFKYMDWYSSGSGRYYLIDADTYWYVRKYINIAYKERMEEYKIYLDSKKAKDYFYTYHNKDKKTRDFVADYRDNMFECEYGTAFKDMSTESKLLIITPGTDTTVRSNYMVFNFTYNVGENATDIIKKMSEKRAQGVCRHYALATQTICDMLGITCWSPVDYGYNHQWGFMKTKSEAGKTVYYTMDNEHVHVTHNEKDLKNERLGDYSPAVRAALGSAYKTFLSDTSNIGWKKINGAWYYLNSNGKKVKGWKKDGGYWYYLDKDGKMVTGWRKVDGKWYYLTSSGAMATGWKKIKGTWYYLKADGARKSGWLNDNGTWYYLEKDGKMVTGSHKIDGKTYKFNGSGAWVG